MSQEAANAFIRECWGLQGASYLVLGLRYTHQFTTYGMSNISGDDILMFLATLVYTAESVAAHFVVAYWKGLANNGMTDEQRAALDPSDPEYELRVNGSKTHVIGLLLYATLLWILKGCWIFYYGRLGNGITNVQRMVYWGRWIVPVTYVSCLLVAFLKCIPFEKQWQIFPDPGNSCTPAVSYIQTLYVMAMNTFTDLYLMAIPLPMIWKAQMPWKKKISLIIMFSGGFLELAFGVLRAVSVLTVGNKDPAQSGYWSVRESFVSYVLTNMPMVYPMFKKFIDRSRNASSRRTGLEDSHGYRLESRPEHKSKGGLSQSAAADKTNVWDSKEHIVVNSDDGYPASLPESDSVPATTQSGASRPGSKRGVPDLEAQSRNSRSWAPRERSEQIFVTKEYTVSVDRNAEQQSGAQGSMARAW